jgi:hypothetical protein
METLQTPFTKYQLELLTMFNDKSITDEDWHLIKDMVSDYFGKKSIEDADKVWDERGWNEKKVDEILKTHLRTSYNPSNQPG